MGYTLNVDGSATLVARWHSGSGPMQQLPEFLSYTQILDS